MLRLITRRILIDFFLGTTVTNYMYNEFYFVFAKNARNKLLRGEGAAKQHWGNLAVPNVTNEPSKYCTNCHTVTVLHV